MPHLGRVSTYPVDIGISQKRSHLALLTILSKKFSGSSDRGYVFPRNSLRGPASPLLTGVTLDVEPFTA